MISSNVLELLAEAALKWRTAAEALHGKAAPTAPGSPVPVSFWNTAIEFDLLAEVARLLNTDFRLRDALGEARDRAANRTLCAECGEPSSAAINGKPLCGACYDAANAANLVLVGPQEQAAPMEDDEPIRPGVRVEVLHPQPSRNVFTNATLYKGSGGIVISADTGVLGDCWFVRLDRPKLPMWMGTETSFRAADLRVVTADEPDLAPSDAQDDEAGEVTP